MHPGQQSRLQAQVYYLRNACKTLLAEARVAMDSPTSNVGNF